MKNTVKRMLSGVMAMTMVMCGSVVSVNAATLEDAAAEIELDSGVTLPYIDVTVPTAEDGSAEITLNPFNLGALGQIYSGNFEVINNSEVPIVVTFKEASVTPSESITLAAKAPAATSTAKEALVNLTYTDATGKPVSKALSDTASDITVTNAMSPLGGKVTYTITGSTSVSPAEAWADTDTITVKNAFSFAPQPFTKYSITKTIALYATDSATVDATDSSAENPVNLPSSVLGDGKIEVPVVWVDKTDAGFDAGDETTWVKYDPTDPAAGKYTAMLSITTDEDNGQTLSNADIYSVAVAMPEITVTVTE